MENGQKIKIRDYVSIIAGLLFLLIWQQAGAGSMSSREYQVKAAFLYNFLTFVDWPAEKIPANDEPIVIGIIGDDPFGDAFDPIKDKDINGRRVIVKWFKGIGELKKSDVTVINKASEAIRKCHLLFICSSEEGVVKEIVDLVKGYNVLTVGDMDKSLESSGVIIKFIPEEERVHFEINNTVALQAKLQIRLQLLRLAKKVIGQEL